MSASAFGLESIDFPMSASPSEKRAVQAKKYKALDDQFQNSDSLKALLEKSNANRADNMKKIKEKYCYRQAEMGVGDCGGLQLIPGMTKNGIQKRPEWLDNALGIQAAPAAVDAAGAKVPEPSLDTLFTATAKE